MLVLDVYTDASGNINSKDFGYSSFFIHEGKEYFSSFMIDQQMLRDILELPKNDKVSNPTVEIFAIRQFLNQFERQLIYNNIKTEISINIYSDYIGCSKWMNKEWAIGKLYISKVVFSCRSILKRLELNHLTKVEFHWVKGHNKIYGNEMADKYAGERLDVSNLNEFFKTIKV